ncbi:MAG: hypothetical protein ACTHY8_09760 [Microbacterium gubbeenense]|uniref:hypothetical protein n=1 Tax=Microbacterium gubbeenense TaxID=159896 RepID=UPI00040F56D8|nr:hypothetical protein [Microbacterium gubbeenense]
MHIAASIVTLAAEAEHHGNVMLETLPIAFIAVAIFGVLALVTASYTNVAHRHADPAERNDESSH